MARQRLPEDERQPQIMQAALRVGAEQGLIQLTVRNVAKEAGVSHGLVIHHFGSKQGLQVALLNQLIKELLTPPSLPDSSLPVEDQLMWVIREQLTYLREKTALIGLLLEFRILGRTDPSLKEQVRAELDAVHLTYLPFTRALVARSPKWLKGASAIPLAKTIGYLLIGYEINRFTNPDSTNESDVLDTLAALLRTGESTLA